jgi:hypothetical protein
MQVYHLNCDISDRAHGMTGDGFLLFRARHKNRDAGND